MDGYFRDRESTDAAFEGGWFRTGDLARMDSVSTLIVLIYYGEKQVEFLFGLRAANVMKYVYVGAIIVGAVGGARFIWGILDITLAAMVIPNMIALVLLSGEVKSLKDEFFGSEKYYPRDVGGSDEHRGEKDLTPG